MTSERESDEVVQIILVWGTFAADADWVQKGSYFRQTLRRFLKELNVTCEFHVYSWSAVNSHIARYEASLKLESMLLALAKRTRGDIHIIGHSHGGSVAYNTLNSSTASSKVTRFFSLGTPFF